MIKFILSMKKILFYIFIRISELLNLDPNKFEHYAFLVHR